MQPHVAAKGNFCRGPATRVTMTPRPTPLPPRESQAVKRRILMGHSYRALHPYIAVPSAGSSPSSDPMAPWTPHDAHHPPNSNAQNTKLPVAVCLTERPAASDNTFPQQRHLRGWPRRQPPHPKLPKHNRPGTPSCAQLQYWPTPCQLLCAVVPTFRLGMAQAHRTAKLQTQDCRSTAAALAT